MAIKSFKALHKVNTETTLGYYQMSISYKAAGRFKEAVKCLETIATEDPNVVSVQFHLGLAYLGLKKITKAMKCFEKVIELNTEHKGAKDKMDLLLTDQEMLYGYGIASQKEDHTKEEIITNFHVGQTYKGMGMIEEAFKHFKDQVIKKK
jgi:tetratricopeptide (TPR) repeat protein